MNSPQNISVRVVHRYRNSPEGVFDAWLDPAMIGRWMFGPALRDEEVVHLNVDARVGGSFSFLVRRQGKELDHVGEYLELDRPRRLVFTWGVREGGQKPDMSTVTVEVLPSDGGSELTLTHDLHPDWADYAGKTEQGWTKMLGALETSLD
jgi:uncharacterized protein YndB with AHSA1/START domain